MEETCRYEIPRTLQKDKAGLWSETPNSVVQKVSRIFAVSRIGSKTDDNDFSLYDHKNKWPLPKDPAPMPNANTLIGACEDIPRSRNVCTDRANYHQQLAMLGKTPMSNEEIELFPYPAQLLGGTVDNPLFLYELGQFSDSNETRRDQLVHDLENFIGLPAPFPERGNPSSGSSKRKKLEICEPEYDNLRRILLEAAQRSAWWIRHYLLKSNTVYVSNREHFLELLDTWNEDPCASGDY